MRLAARVGVLLIVGATCTAYAWGEPDSGLRLSRAAPTRLPLEQKKLELEESHLAECRELDSGFCSWLVRDVRSTRRVVEEYSAASEPPTIGGVPLETAFERCRADAGAPELEPGACAQALSVEALSWLETPEALVELKRRARSGAVRPQVVAFEQMRVGMRHTPCAPPTVEEIARARAGLEDYAMVREREDGGLYAEPPTSAELDDLAYLYTAVAENDPPIERFAEAHAIIGRDDGGVMVAFNMVGDPESESTELDALAKAALSAPTDDETERASLAFLTRLGWPQKTRQLEVQRAVGPGSPRANEVLRSYAAAAERNGHLAEATLAYRNANPGGGWCGTSDGYNIGKQSVGAIRTTEATRGCRPVVVERLSNRVYDFVNPELTEDENPFGPGRLVRAGFDVDRLYRASILTRHRTWPRTDDELLRALSSAPGKLGDVAVVRFKLLGREDWESRIHGLDNLAWHRPELALPWLRERLLHGGPQDQQLARQHLDAVVGRRNGRGCLPRPAEDPSTREELRAAMKREKDPARLVALAEAAASLRDETLAPDLAALLRNRHALQAPLVHALGKARLEGTQAALQRALVAARGRERSGACKRTEWICSNTCLYRCPETLALEEVVPQLPEWEPASHRPQLCELPTERPW